MAIKLEKNRKYYRKWSRNLRPFVRELPFTQANKLTNSLSHRQSNVHVDTISVLLFLGFLPAPSKTYKTAKSQMSKFFMIADALHIYCIMENKKRKEICTKESIFTHFIVYQYMQHLFPSKTKSWSFQRKNLLLNASVINRIKMKQWERTLISTSFIFGQHKAQNI